MIETLIAAIIEIPAGISSPHFVRVVKEVAVYYHRRGYVPLKVIGSQLIAAEPEKSPRKEAMLFLISQASSAESPANLRPEWEEVFGLSPGEGKWKEG